MIVSMATLCQQGCVYQNYLNYEVEYCHHTGLCLGSCTILVHTYAILINVMCRAWVSRTSVRSMSGTCQEHVRNMSGMLYWLMSRVGHGYPEQEEMLSGAYRQHVGKHVRNTILINVTCRAWVSRTRNVVRSMSGTCQEHYTDWCHV